MPQRVLFEAWRGRYDDNPRAVSEYMSIHCASLKRTWVTDGRRDGSLQQPSTVRRQTAKYFLALARSNGYVTNDMSPRMPPRRPGAVYVQTWHGTPLKKIGFDIYPPGERNTAYARRLAKDVARWDILLSPSPEMTVLLRSAFDYEGAVLESGYPRNDAVVNATSEQRSAARRRLGIPEGASTVLHMPTWRESVQEGLHIPTWTDELDAVHLREQLGSAWVVLARLHPVMSGSKRAAHPPGVIDVTNHHDVRELYMAADALVTDYSSAMFDFAVTNRPIVLFVPDLEEYTERARGLYYDIRQIAPGPVTETWEETAAALQEESQRAGQRESYRAFRDRFLPFEDGRSAGRVVRALTEAMDV